MFMRVRVRFDSSINVHISKNYGHLLLDKDPIYFPYQCRLKEFDHSSYRNRTACQGPWTVRVQLAVTFTGTSSSAGFGSNATRVCFNGYSLQLRRSWQQRRKLLGAGPASSHNGTL